MFGLEFEDIIKQAPTLLLILPFLVYITMKVRFHDTKDSELEKKVDALESKVDRNYDCLVEVKKDVAVLKSKSNGSS